ncbi:hypothetical protein [Altererythrobacter sp. C41]|uniref:hypothetical protein n=1 Tax=Altererythrobacter sp. C41 TaxID=2806021 RepID=UPI0019322669|nr:hypothetical protein [Altererythrobacter sp. C41]MBM0169168.1 hypothetical protein [Altererythrobacter sp. C41]
MKVQIGSVALAEPGYMLFQIHLHDELRAEIDASGGGHKDYLRDRIARCARALFGGPRWFFFVMEDQSPDGDSTRPHAHGSIEVRPATLPARGERHHLRYRRLAERMGQAHAERICGLALTKDLLRVASGNRRADRPTIVQGVHQGRNVWTSTPKRPFFNDQWVTYAFKNIDKVSPTLPDDRLAFSQSLRTESRRLWNLIRIGEEALSQWP